MSSPLLTGLEKISKAVPSLISLLIDVALRFAIKIKKGIPATIK